MAIQKKSGYTAPYNAWYDGKLYEIDTSAKSGFTRKIDADARKRDLINAGNLARVKRISRKIAGKTVVRYHVYVRHPW
jgi:hypothetical protein